MADFVQKTVTKTAVRELAMPIADIASFDAIVQSVITTNPFGCVAYTEAGVTHDPVEKTKEAYGMKTVYQDALAQKIGTGSESYHTIAGFNAGITAVLANAANITAHGGSIVRDPGNDTYSVILNCRDPNGELYRVTLSRDRLNVSSYSDDAILATVETWADTVTALA